MDHAIESLMEGARRRATYDDLLAVPDHLVAEIIDGELYTSPRPAPPHAVASSAILSVLFDRFHGSSGSGAATPGGWWILIEPELHFGDDVLVPDVAGWRRARMPAVPDTAYFTTPPDWVCEVISPSSGRLDRVKKMPVYARAGVAHLWLVDPIARTLEASFKDKITVVIPTLNEREAIGRVIEEVKKNDYTKIMVVDGYSTDKTAEIAHSSGAKVVFQHGVGKAGAVKTAIELVDTPYMVFIDGDYTYDPRDI